jgi:hypothetical protein
MNKQQKLNELYGEDNIIDGELFDDEDVIKLEELLNIYEKSLYWFHKDKNLKGIIFRVSNVEENTKLINILLYYMCKLSYFVFVRIGDLGTLNMCHYMDVVLSDISSWMRKILIFNDCSENRKYHSLFDNVDYVLKNDEFYISVHIARAMIKEYYEDIMNSNLKPSIKGILIKRMINKYKDYSLPEQGFEHLNLVNDLNFRYIDLYIPDCQEAKLIDEYVDFVNDRMTDYNITITTQTYREFIGFHTFVKLFKIDMNKYKIYLMNKYFDDRLRYGIEFGLVFNVVYGPNWYLKM